MKLVILLTFFLFAIPFIAQAQIIEIPECGIDLPISDPFCQWLCAHSDPKPDFCPTEPERDPIVLVPGITVSQNRKLLYKDKAGSQWKFALGFNVYKGLIKKLETAGYEQGQDLFIAHYDWRNPAAHNAITYLKPMIDQAKQATGASKVDVVAHSFGGLVTRAYIQSDEYTNDIDQLITLGSPHEGSADSYVAWEGGIFPEGWNFFVTSKIRKVEDALKKSRDQEDLLPPESFRAFFPALHDMLPLADFVSKDGNLLAVTSLVEQNTFLRSLHDTLSSIATKGVRLATIAGTNVPTLGQINISNERSREDKALSRWRDGAPNPLPPPLNSEAGDARVLLSSAHIGSSNTTLINARHHKLPDEAQDTIFELLDLEPQPSFFSTFPKKIFSIVILSPLTATIEGPNDELLSPTQNDFGPDAAEYDDDPNDPDDPIEINIADPPDGEYQVTYTGTGEGDYTIITSYADENETVSSVQDGTTTQGEIITQTITIGNDTTSLTDDADYKQLLEHVVVLAKQAKKDKLLKGHEYATIIRLATHAQNDLRYYEKRSRKDREEAALKRLRSYYQNLHELKEVAAALETEHDLAQFAGELRQVIEKIIRHSPPL